MRRAARWRAAAAARARCRCRSNASTRCAPATRTWVTRTGISAWRMPRSCSRFPSAELARLRNVTILMLIALLVGVGLAAYGLGFLIARPLERLSSAAARVTSGELNVELPAGGSGEVG